MNISHNKTDNSVGLITISISAEDYAPAVDKAMKTAQRKANIPGFRAGMVPLGLVKKMYAKNAVADELNQICQRSLYNYINTNNLNILGSPMPSETIDVEGNFENPTNFIFYYDIAFAPEFSLELNKSRRFTQKLVKIGEDVLNDELDRLARRYGTLTEISKPLSEEDAMHIDLLEANEDGNLVEGGFFKEMFLTPKQVSDSETKDKLLQLETGGTLLVNPRFLNSNEGELARSLGDLNALPEKVILKVTKIQKLEKAIFNDEFFTTHYPDGTVQSVDDLKESFRKQISGYYDSTSDQMLLFEVQKDLIEKTPIVLPVDFLKRWLPAANKEVSEESINTEFQKYANGIKWELIEGKIVRENNLAVSAEELDIYMRHNIRERFMQYGLPNVDDETVDKVLQQEIKDQKAYKQHNERILDNKILNVIKQNCTIDMVEVPESAFFAEA